MTLVMFLDFVNFYLLKSQVIYFLFPFILQTACQLLANIIKALHRQFKPYLIIYNRN